MHLLMHGFQMVVNDTKFSCGSRVCCLVGRSAGRRGLCIIDVYIYIHIHIHMHVPMSTQKFTVCMYVCMHAYMHVCM